MTEPKPIPVADVRYVKELYPRLTPSDEVIARYEETLDDLPPIVVARGGALVDGYHRWQAHLRQGRETINAINLGDITDAEIFDESITRNATHGLSLSRDDKRNLAPKLWTARHHLPVPERVRSIAELLAVADYTVREWTQDIRAQEKADQKARAWDAWLNCETQTIIASDLGVDQKTISNWLGEMGKSPEFLTPPDPHMAFDFWTYAKHEGDSTYFGKMHPGVVENLLWLYTDPGHIVFDPFAGAGTTIHVAKKMGRRVWASDRASAAKYPGLPIHTHDITTGWPADAPKKVDLILLDPPYWKQAAGRYSDDPADLGNMTLDEFNAAWANVVKTCAAKLTDGGRLAYIISPSQCEDGTVVDHATDMLRACWDIGLTVERRIIVPYSTQQATGQQVDWARENRKLLKLYRDLVVLK